MNGDPRFHAKLQEMGELHASKSSDYTAGRDPLYNLRASTEFGVAPWIATLIRLNDKIGRLQSFARKGTLNHESATDSMIDIAVYAILASILYDEESEKVSPEAS